MIVNLYDLLINFLITHYFVQQQKQPVAFGWPPLGSIFKNIILYVNYIGQQKKFNLVYFTQFIQTNIIYY